MILSAIAEKLKRRSKDDFKGRHFEATLIVQAVSWYLRYPLSYRDIEELFLERGLEVDHSTLNRWVLAYAPLIEKRLRAFRKPHCGSVRIDETYIKVRGQWRYLYRAIDKHGNPVDFLLTAKRDLDAAKRFFRKALKEEPLLSPDRIGTDGAGAYPPAIAAATHAAQSATSGKGDRPRRPRGPGANRRSQRSLAAHLPHVLTSGFLEPLPRSPIIAAAPAIRGAVVSGSVVARVSVVGWVGVVVGRVGVVGWRVAVAVIRVAVAIVRPGAGRQRPKRKAADETGCKRPATIVGSPPAPAIAAPTPTTPPLHVLGRGSARDRLGRGYGQRDGL